MRIIAGQARGRRLAAVKGSKTRPTADRVKEALFNVLAGRIPDAQCLDLFAGTGALGLEALSRGAEQVYWVEKDHDACRIIQKNMDTTGLANGTILRQDVYSACRTLLQQGKRFDLIFADPPYKQNLLPAVLELVAAGLLSADGVLILETSRDETLPERIGRLGHLRSNRYGDTMIHYYQWVES
ncbi:16S rRNA (guanine(966)-N(2))-methyltransferase RsmD [Heliobacillus mobilis]|uniref:16S rRNA (Guanine(966)-N(2))-methyltransferase RsmD n=1 Tax=Heliobacterium mobile TaxID=28064 RepID=A0A6I3SDD1_HELMO|nr:16S rRNA (guanine(966)-N(2))-methyltransferase RsmD [Heliobacterium mobile]MTV47655.1 16S rRNA (guanine(966)-N(2))-methyltransferase RsmD [Heliobacterium mobile]